MKFSLSAYPQNCNYCGNKTQLCIFTLGDGDVKRLCRRCATFYIRRAVMRGVLDPDHFFNDAILDFLLSAMPVLERNVTVWYYKDERTQQAGWISSYALTLLEQAFGSSSHQCRREVFCLVECPFVTASVLYDKYKIASNDLNRKMINTLKLLYSNPPPVKHAFEEVRRKIDLILEEVAFAGKRRQRWTSVR